MGFRGPWVGFEGFVVGIGSSGWDFGVPTWIKGVLNGIGSSGWDFGVPTWIKGLLNGIGSSGWDFGVLGWDLRVLWLGLGLLDGISGSLGGI